MTRVLGIESSCDDMAAAVVEDGRHILSSVVHSQDAVHRPFGGVVPELASRDHVRHVHQTVAAALDRAGVRLEDLDGIGVTSGPGLIGSLLIGLSFAKALAYRAGLPLVGVHHIEGHLASSRLGDDPLELPFLGLVVSGGHTALYHVESLARIELLGQTRDDASGEAFDKVAKRLGLGYPGGREVDLHARRGRTDAYPFPRPLLADPGLDFSFSGLKTAVALAVAREEERARASGALLSGPLDAGQPASGQQGEGAAEPGATILDEAVVCDLCASFQEAAIDVLVGKTERALEQRGLARVAVVGGLAANSRLRERMEAFGQASGVEVRFPDRKLCTDNAAMIAAVADRLLAEGVRAPLTLEAFSRVALPSTQATPAAGVHEAAG